MDTERCGAALPGGRQCQVRRDRCRWHRAGESHDRPDFVAPPGQGAPVRRAALPRRASLPQRPAGLQERDTKALAWALLERLLDGSQDARTVATAAALLRLIAGLGPEDPDLDEALAAVELHGRAWHGLGPRDSDEWRRAESLFGPEALEEMSRWAEEDGTPDR